MILALETSSSLCAVCVLDETSGTVLADVSGDIGRGHAEQLMDDISAVLEAAGIGFRDLTAVAAGVGPGSFTGIRVGVAAARGFGLALKLPVFGVSSLQAIAIQARGHASGNGISVILDGGREEVFVQSFNSAALPLDEPRALPLAGVLQQLPPSGALLCGSGAALLSGQHLPDGMRIHAAPLQATAIAVAMACANPALTLPPKPLYLRAPDAKTQAGFAVTRMSA